MMLWKSIRIVLFDAVGTLIRPEPVVTDVYWQAGRRFGSRRTRDEIRTRLMAAWDRHEPRCPADPAATVGADNAAPSATDRWFRHRLTRPPTCEHHEHTRWRNIVAAVFDDLPDCSALFAALWEHFAAGRHWRLYDDVEPAWRWCQQRGLRVGIASNFDRRLERICRELPLLAACEAIFCSSAVGYSKPDPRFFEQVAFGLGVEPAEIALVGDDRVNDEEGARAAGWQAIRIDRDAGSATAMSIRSLPEIGRDRPEVDGITRTESREPA